MSLGMLIHYHILKREEPWKELLRAAEAVSLQRKIVKHRRIDAKMEFAHETLDADIKGVKLVRDGIDIAQYRGLQYGRIARRFARPDESTVGDAAEKNASKGPSWRIDATSFG